MDDVVPAGAIAIGASHDWQRLRQLMEEVDEGLARPSDCGHAGQFMARAAATRAALDRVVHGLQRAHLSCCTLPHLGAPDEIVLALTRLSEARVGALIVIAQQMCLDEYVARGTPLDAALSASLLGSLFFPGSKLHDIAVVVRGPRIIAAGVFLRIVTERRDPLQGHTLGARHRAALALSRLTDALISVLVRQRRDQLCGTCGSWLGPTRGCDGVPRIAAPSTTGPTAPRPRARRAAPRRTLQVEKRHPPASHQRRRTSPRTRMRDASVVGRIPSSSAAPPGP